MDLHTLTTQFPGGWGFFPSCSQPPIWRNRISYCSPLIPEMSVLVSWHRFETWCLDSSELFDAQSGSAWGEWREGGRLWDRSALWRPVTHTHTYTHHGRHQGKKRIGRKVMFYFLFCFIFTFSVSFVALVFFVHIFPSRRLHLPRIRSSIHQ